MCAARKSLRQIQLPQALEKITLRTRMLLDNSVVQVMLAKDLCQTSSDLLQENADFRDFLRENRLTGLSLYEQWLDGGGNPKIS
jgi:hypothetical protein